MNHLVEQPVPLLDTRRGRLPLADLLLDPPSLREQAFKSGRLWTCYVHSTRDRFWALIQIGPARDETREAVQSQITDNSVVTIFEAVGSRDEVARQALSLSSPAQTEVLLKFRDT